MGTPLSKSKRTLIANGGRRMDAAMAHRVQNAADKDIDQSYGAIIPTVTTGLQPYTFQQVHDRRSKVKLNDVGGACDVPMHAQGKPNTCTAEAAAAAFVCVARKQFEHLNVVPSVLFTYFYARIIRGGPKAAQVDGGATINEALTAMTMGVCPSILWPYKSELLFTEPTVVARRQAMYYAVTDWRPLDPRLNNLRNCIASGYPFLLAFEITMQMDTWFRNEQQQQQSQYLLMTGDLDQRSTPVGGHAVLVVGYDDNAFGGVGAMYCRNSWGSQWGNGGYFWISYSTITNPNLARDFAAILRVCTHVPATDLRCVVNCPTTMYGDRVC